MCRKSSAELVVGNFELMERIKNDNMALLKETLFLQNSFPQYLLETIKTIKIPAEFMNSKPNDIKIPYHPEAQFLSEEVEVQLR